MQEEKKLDVFYYKNSEDLNTIMDVFYDYNVTKSRPATYFDEQLTNYQCGSFRNRSIDDMLCILRRFFPEITVENLIREIWKDRQQLLKDGDRYIEAPIIYLCMDIQKPVFMINDLVSANRVNELFHERAFRSGYQRHKMHSEYSMDDLVTLFELIKEEG